MLDYYSDSPTFALAASPLSTSSATSLRLAVGSYSETRVPTASSSSSSSSSANSSANYTNHLTVAAVDPAVDLEDDSDSESETAYRSRSTRQRVLHPSSGSGGAFRAVARTPLLYPPSAVQFAPARLSGSLASGTGGNAGFGESEQREVLATSSESLRLWDLVTEQDDGSGTAGRVGSGNGFVGGSAGHSSRSRLVSRATLQNVSTASRCFFLSFFFASCFWSPSREADFFPLRASWWAVQSRILGTVDGLFLVHARAYANRDRLDRHSQSLFLRPPIFFYLA